MEIKVNSEVEAQREVTSGLYGRTDEYPVELRHDRRDWSGESSDDFHAGLEAAWQEAERGELMDEDEVRREMRAMKAEYCGRKPAA